MDEPIPKTRRRPLWWELFADFFRSLGELSTGALALAGAIWYGFLWISYNRFYEPLGIIPSDVGLNYATILANSVGAAVAFLIPLAAIVISLVIFATSVRLRGYQYSRERQSWVVLVLTRAMRNTLIIFGIIGMAFLIYTFPVTAQTQAQKVIAGRAVTPLHSLWWSPAPILTIHADPVIAISSTGAKKAGESVAVETLAPTSLLYMGQANGIMVLYNSSTDQAIYLPASSVLLTIEAGRI
jgi:hypothetical protein